MKILIVKLSSLGDILHLFPAVSDLQRHFPEAEIHWLVEPAFAEVVEWHSAVDKIITVSLRAHKKVWWKIPAMLGKLRQQLKDENYNFVLDAQGLLKSALLARLAGTSVFGFASGSARESLSAWFYQRSVNLPDSLHVIDKNRQLVAKIFKADITQTVDFGLDNFRYQILNAGLSGAQKELCKHPYIVLLHGTTWDSKYWPEASWEELIRLLTCQGWQCLLPWGNEIEHLRAHRMQATCVEHSQVLPKMSLTDLMAVLLHARAFVSVESGIGHLAAALDIPGIMLHGPTSPGYSGIFGKSCQHLTSTLACSPCFKRDCPILNGAEFPPCQQAISPQRVYQQCLKLIT